MEHNYIYDIIGYVASAVILSSFTMTSTVKLRVINSIGGFLNIIYSLLISAYPTAICNICILCINAYYLLRVLHNHQNNYAIVPCTINDGLYRCFIAKYAQDIAKFYPHFNAQDKSQNFARFIFSRNEVVGLQVGKLKGDTMCLTVDYSIPEYRDCSVGRYAYTHLRKNIKHAVVKDAQPACTPYLTEIGFVGNGKRLSLDIA